MVSHGSAHACSRMPSAPRPDLSLARERVRELPASVLGELGPAALSSSPLVLRGPSRVGGMDGERGDAGPGGVAGEGGEARGLLVRAESARRADAPPSTAPDDCLPARPQSRFELRPSGVCSCTHACGEAGADDGDELLPWARGRGKPRPES